MNDKKKKPREWKGWMVSMFKITKHNPGVFHFQEPSNAWFSTIRVRVIEDKKRKK